MSEANVNKGYKKKKKKSYLSRAKKFGKSGRFGHGSHVSEDTYNYFVRVVEINKGKFETEEEREIFVANTFEQTVGQEMTLATNQFTSYALEQLLPSAKHESLDKFMNALASDLRPICCDIFASHVIQGLLKTSSERLQKLMSSEDEEDDVWCSKYMDWILKVGRFLLNNVEEFAWEMYANPIVRTVLEVISGGTVTHCFNKEKTTKKVDTSDYQVPKLLRNLLKEYCTTIASLPQLSDLMSSPLTSGLLQSLVLAASRGGIKRLLPLSEKILEVLKSKKNLDDPSARLLESVLSVAPSPLFNQIFEDFFKGQLTDMSCQSNTNFSVQRLFDSCPDKEQLLLLLEEMESAEVLEAIFKTGFTGVALAMAQACERLGAGQGNLIQNLMSVLQCSSPPERQLQVAPLILALQPYDKYEKVINRRSEDDPPLVTLHGSLLLQALLNFNKPIKLVQSLLHMKPTELAAILSDSKGSHVTDSYMSSAFVGEKSREKLCQHLKGQWTTMACSIWGSRSLDAAWRSSSVKARQSIVSELSQQIPRLKGDKQGRFVLQACGVELYKHNPKEWSELQGKGVKNKRLAKDLLDSLPNKKIKKQ